MDLYVLGEKNNPPYDGEVILRKESKEEAIAMLGVLENTERLSVVGSFAIRLNETDLQRYETLPTIKVIDHRQA